MESTANGTMQAVPRGALARSYAYCERLARREAGNFYHAFRLLPAHQRRAMCALYAFLRIADDLADGTGASAAKRVALDAWEAALDAALAGCFNHRLHPALRDTVVTYRIPRDYLVAVLDGVRLDLEPVAFATFDDLYPYCYRVASAVGLACIHIWGFRDPQAKVHAEQAGIAFQLTNILRDLAEDAARGRVYLPRMDLERFGYSEQELRQGARNEQFRALMRFEAERAHRYYRDAEALLPLLPAHGRAVFQVMLHTYRGLLLEIERRDFDVFSGRVSLGRWRKLALVLAALPTRCGWGVGP
ncbi:MAG: phytoene/squalene synthase family protein [Planctomycetia bacterium]|nr:phytoene/squalene synthase family protein [Planctomycetia bacterium]